MTKKNKEKEIVETKKKRGRPKKEKDIIELDEKNLEEYAEYSLTAEDYVEEDEETLDETWQKILDESEESNFTEMFEKTTGVKKKKNKKEKSERDTSDANASVMSAYSRYVRSIRQYPVLTSDELNELFKTMNSDSSTPEERKEARDKIILHNLRFVITVTKRYLNRGVDSMDLIQEGTRGLMTAVEKFDYTQGYKFSTYAVWWIGQAAQRSIQNTSRTIRLPIHICDLLNRVKKVSKEMAEELGRMPTDKEIVKRINKPSVTLKAIREARERSGQIISMETPIKNPSKDSTETATVASFIPDNEKYIPEKAFENNFMKSEIRTLLNTILTEDEKNVIICRFGIDIDKPLSIEKTSSDLKISRNRVKDLEASAIAKLKNSPHIEDLRDFLS